MLDDTGLELAWRVSLVQILNRASVCSDLTSFKNCDIYSPPEAVGMAGMLNDLL